MSHFGFTASDGQTHVLLDDALLGCFDTNGDCARWMNICKTRSMRFVSTFASSIAKQEAIMTRGTQIPDER